MNNETIKTPTLDAAVAAEQNLLLASLVELLTTAQREQLDRILVERAAG